MMACYCSCMASTGKGDLKAQARRRFQKMKRRRDGLEGTPEQQAAAIRYFTRKRRPEIKRRRYARHRDRLNTAAKAAHQEKLEAIAGRPRPIVCEICGLPSHDARAIHFDRCHTTGAFRGWLCVRCNHTLGKAKDSPALLRKLADYLENPIGPTACSATAITTAPA